jgi:hypothetical protein
MLTLIDTMPFPSSNVEGYGPKEAQKLVNKTRKKRVKLLNILKNAKSQNELKKAQHEYVGSADVRFAAIIEAAKKVPFQQRLDVDTYRIIATELEIQKPIDEPVYVRIKPKSSGGHRLYCDYGVKQRTAQIIAADMLSPKFIRAPFQFDSVHRAIRAARKYISLGFKHGRHLDVKSFFDKISHEYILGPALKMEPGIQASVLTGKFLKLVKGYDYGPSALYSSYCIEIASAGTPQGSATSPLVASILLSKLDLSSMPEDVVVLNYVDDFLILAKEEADLEAGSDALQAALTALSAGDLLLVQKSTQANATNFTYLGHLFATGGSGQPSIIVSPASLHSFNVKVAKLAEALEGEAQAIAKLMKLPLSSPIHQVQFSGMVMELAAWIKAWLLAFSEADDIKDLGNEFGAYVSVVCDNLGLKNGSDIWANAKAHKALSYSEIISTG